MSGSLSLKRNPITSEQFTIELSKALKNINSDYEAKRHKNIALGLPLVHIAKKELFTEWLKSKGKLGGQHKVPRLSNERTMLEEILLMNKNYTT